jgi:two-component system, NtrC family, response regulator HydG
VKERKNEMTETKSVLVVDDNEDLLATFSSILRRRGFAVETAEDGAAAVDKFRERRFDVTLMDIVMPQLDGVSAFRKIREIDPEARVILMTAYSEEELIERALREGAHCVVSKPIRIDRMIELIKENAASFGPVLLVDDDPDILDTMTRALQREGCEVVAADSGEEAVLVSRDRTFPVAFIDIKLPVMNGLETFLRLKNTNPGITAIMMTGYREEMRKTIDAALAASAATCLYKPFDPLKALDLIRQLNGRPKDSEKA